jgi:hypothetical protein
MAYDMVKIHEYAAELFRLAERVISSGSSVKVRFTIGTGKTFCRVMIAEEGRELTEDENVYNLFAAPEKWAATATNYQRCRRRLIRILAEIKKP